MFHGLTPLKTSLEFLGDYNLHVHLPMLADLWNVLLSLDQICLVLSKKTLLHPSFILCT